MTYDRTDDKSFHQYAKVIKVKRYTDKEIHSLKFGNLPWFLLKKGR